MASGSKNTEGSPPAGIPDRRGGNTTLDGLLLRTLLSTAPIGIAFYDRDLRFLRINDAFAQMNGLPAQMHLGHTLAELRPDAASDATDHLQQVFASGEPLTNIEIRGSVSVPPEEERYWLASYYPIRDDRRQGEIVGLGTVVIEITERKRAEAERERLVRELTEATERQRRFLREMLSGVTGGRLVLHDAESRMPEPLPIATDRVPLSIASLRHIRKDVRDVAARMGFADDRWQDLETAVGEATMNAVVHAGGGSAWVCSDVGGDRIQVWVRDHGPGIAEELLHRATLERGYTTAGTLGHGFWMMLQTADQTHLRTGPGGTTIVLEQHRIAPKPIWFQGF